MCLERLRKWSNPTPKYTYNPVIHLNEQRVTVNPTSLPKDCCFYEKQLVSVTTHLSSVPQLTVFAKGAGSPVGPQSLRLLPQRSPSVGPERRCVASPATGWPETRV